MRESLKTRGWTQRPKREHRWYGPRGGIVDIMPAGREIRAQGHLVWPESQMQMSVVGFSHVFTKAEEREIAPALRMKVIPIPVLTLLKIASYLDRPTERYETDNYDRLFSDDVVAAGISFDCAGAFLLGLDLGRICSLGEQQVVAGFVDELRNEASRGYAFLRRTRIGFLGDSDYRERDLRAQITAFAEGSLRGTQQQ